MRALALGVVGALALLPVASWAKLHDDDVVLLERNAQLAMWLGEPVSLKRGLCVQASYELRWPGAIGAVDQAQQDALHAAVEQCGADDEGTRIVGQARKAFQERLARLSTLGDAVSSCRTQAGDEVARCMAKAVGRPLSSQQQQLVLRATGSGAR